MMKMKTKGILCVAAAMLAITVKTETIIIGMPAADTGTPKSLCITGHAAPMAVKGNPEDMK